MNVEGAEDSKGEIPEQDEDGASPETPQPSSPALPRHFSVQEHPRRRGARGGGADYILCECETLAAASPGLRPCTSPWLHPHLPHPEGPPRFHSLPPSSDRCPV